MADNMNFTVYSKDGCPYCTKVVEVLRIAHLKHVVYKLDKDFDRDSFYGQFGQGCSFRLVDLVHHYLGGCSDTVKYLQENNLV